MANEDFTTYTEVDPDGTHTITASQISFEDRSRGTTDYVVSDKGVDHFDGDFTHQFVFQWSGTVTSLANDWWAVANLVGSTAQIQAASGTQRHMRIGSDAKVFIQSREGGGVDDSDPMVGATSASTDYYITIVNNYAAKTMVLYIRTGSHEGTLVDTLTIAVTTQTDFRYIYGVIGLDSGTGTADGYLKDLNLNEATEATFAVLQEYFQENFQAIGNN